MGEELQNAVARLKELRTGKHFTYRALAEKLGVSPTALCRIEMGARIPSPELLSSICNILELSKAEREDLMLRFGYVDV